MIGLNYMKIRLDAELVRRELARSRENASDLIESRSVLGVNHEFIVYFIAIQDGLNR